MPHPVKEVDTGEFLALDAGMSAVMARDRHQQSTIEQLTQLVRELAATLHHATHDTMTPIHQCSYMACRRVREVLLGTGV